MKRSAGVFSFLLLLVLGPWAYADTPPAGAPAPAAAPAVAPAPAAPAPAPVDFTPDKDRSIIFVYRNDSFLYASSNISVFVAGERVGDMLGSTYIKLSAPPGEHKLLVTGRGGNSSFELLTEKNRVYYLWLDAQSTLPLGPKPLLSLVDNARGKSDIVQCTKCKLADNAESVINDQAAAEGKPEDKKAAEQKPAEQKTAPQKAEEPKAEEPSATGDKSVVKSSDLPKADIRAKFQSLKDLLDEGVITKDEYEAKRKQLLESL